MHVHFNIFCSNESNQKTAYSPIRMVKSKTPAIPNADKDVKQQGFSLIIGENAKWGVPGLLSWLSVSLWLRS